MNRTADDTLVNNVITVLDTVLVLEDAVGNVDRNTALVGNLPGFDSHSVVALMLELEDEFGITFEDDEVSAELFETVGTLADFVAEKIAD